MHHPKCDVKSSNLCIKIGSCIWFAVVKHIDGETRIIFKVEFPSLAFVLKILYGQKELKEVGTKIYKGMTLWCYFLFNLYGWTMAGPLWKLKVSIADNWQGRGWRFGVALNSRWVLWSFLSQINPISWQLMWILSNIFFESLLNKNKKYHYVWGRFQSGLSIIKSLKMATLNSSREASAAARSNIFYRLIKASPDFIFNGTEWKRALHSDLKIRRKN